MGAKLPRRGNLRKDPEPQAVVGYDPMKVEVLDADPEREYVLALDAEIHGTGVGYYEALGYDVEVLREGGPRVRGSRAKMGEPIQYLGHALMSCSKEHFAALYTNGVGGYGGQRAADRHENAMLDRSQQQDGFRGGERRYKNVGHGVQPTPFMRVSEPSADDDSAFPE